MLCVGGWLVRERVELRVGWGWKRERGKKGVLIETLHDHRTQSGAERMGGGGNGGKRGQVCEHTGRVFKKKSLKKFLIYSNFCTNFPSPFI